MCTCMHVCMCACVHLYVLLLCVLLFECARARKEESPYDKDLKEAIRLAVTAGGVATRARKVYSSIVSSICSSSSGSPVMVICI